MRVERNDHHTCSEAALWQVYEAHEAIRQNPSMIAHNMARAVHNLLHLNTAHVPLLSYHTAQRVANRLPRDLDVIDGIDTVSKLVEQSARHPKIKPIEIEQDALAVRALRDQIPYIKHGLPNTSTVIDLGARRAQK